MLVVVRGYIYIYRSVPLIRPPILYTTSSLKWVEGLYSNMQLVSNISPPPPPPPPPPKKKKVLRNRYVHFQSSCLHKNTVTKAQNSTVRGHHVYKASWSPYIGEELPVQCEVNNIHRRRLRCSCPQEQQYCRSCTTGNFQSAGTSCTRVAAR